MEENSKTTNEYPIHVAAPYPEESSRLLAVATLLFMVPKLILLIPHFIVLYFLGIIMIVVALFAQIVVLFTGKYPRGLYDLVFGAIQWQLRAHMYLLGLTDHYPPFSLK